MLYDSKLWPGWIKRNWNVAMMVMESASRLQELLGLSAISVARKHIATSFNCLQVSLDHLDFQALNKDNSPYDSAAITSLQQTMVPITELPEPPPRFLPITYDWNQWNHCTDARLQDFRNDLQILFLIQDEAMYWWSSIANAWVAEVH